MAISFRDSTRSEVRRPLLGLDRLRVRLAPPKRTAHPPNHIDLVSVLVAKHGISEERALGFLALLQRVKATAPQPYILNSMDLQQFHKLLEVAIPSDRRGRLLYKGQEVAPIDRSTHELIDKVLLEPGQSFKHGMTADQCSVLITVN